VYRFRNYGTDQKPEIGEVLKDGQIRTSVAGDTLVILANHFTARSMNGRFDDVVSVIHAYSI
jgi:hypothetical protein